MNEQLDTELVQRRIAERGLKTNWVLTQCGLRRTSGYQMIRDGLLPKDTLKRNEVLEKLARMLGLQVRQILVRPMKAKTA